MPQALANGSAGFFAGMLRRHLLQEPRRIADDSFIDRHIRERQAWCAGLVREPVAISAVAQAGASRPAARPLFTAGLAQAAISGY